MVQSILLKKVVCVATLPKKFIYDYHSQQNIMQGNDTNPILAASLIDELETETFTRVNGEGTDIHDILII